MSTKFQIPLGADIGKVRSVLRGVSHTGEIEPGQTIKVPSTLPPIRMQRLAKVCEPVPTRKRIKENKSAPDALDDHTVRFRIHPTADLRRLKALLCGIEVASSNIGAGQCIRLVKSDLLDDRHEALRKWGEFLDD